MGLSIRALVAWMTLTASALAQGAPPPMDEPVEAPAPKPAPGADGPEVAKPAHHPKAHAGHAPKPKAKHVAKGKHVAKAKPKPKAKPEPKPKPAVAHKPKAKPKKPVAAKPKPKPTKVVHAPKPKKPATTHGT